MGKHEPNCRRKYIKRRKQKRKKQKPTISDVQNNQGKTTSINSSSGPNIPIIQETDSKRKCDSDTSSCSRAPFIDSSTERSSGGFSDIDSLASSHVRHIIQRENYLKRAENDPLMLRFRAYMYHKKALERCTTCKF